MPSFGAGKLNSFSVIVIIRPHRKISGIVKKSTGGRAEIFFFFSDSVCMYVDILEGHWDARHVRPLTFNTHIFRQCNSMQTPS